MTSPKAYDVFIAHQREDAAIALTIHEHLNYNGVSAFCRAAHDPGFFLGESIYNIVKDSKVFLLIATNGALAKLKRKTSCLGLELRCAIDASLRFAYVRILHDLAAMYALSVNVDPDLLTTAPRAYAHGHPTDRQSLDAIVSLVVTEPVDWYAELSTLTVDSLKFGSLIAGVSATAPQVQEAAQNLLRRFEGLDASRTGIELLDLVGRLGDPSQRSIIVRATLAGLVRQVSRHHGGRTTPADLRGLWPFLRSTLGAVNGLPLRVTRSSQGFLLVPLFYVGDHGHISELLRLHYWPTVEASADPASSAGEFTVHSHQTYGQSWILAGEIVNRAYDVCRTAGALSNTAAQSLYTVRWDNRKEYDVRHRVSSIRNTDKPVDVHLNSVAVFQPGQSYSVPAGTFHDTTNGFEGRLPTVTMFYFDAEQGFESDASVVGPSGLRASPPHQRVVCDEDHFVASIDSLMASRP